MPERFSIVNVVGTVTLNAVSVPSSATPYPIPLANPNAKKKSQSLLLIGGASCDIQAISGSSSSVIPVLKLASAANDQITTFKSRERRKRKDPMGARKSRNHKIRKSKAGGPRMFSRGKLRLRIKATH